MVQYFCGENPFIEAYQRRKHEKRSLFVSRSCSDADSSWEEETRGKPILPVFKNPTVLKLNSHSIEKNRNLLKKAEEQQVFTKHFVLPTDEKGIRQEQTITYQGEQLQKLVMTNTTPCQWWIENAIQEVGLEEAQRLMVESMDKDEQLQTSRTPSRLYHWTDRTKWKWIPNGHRLWFHPVGYQKAVELEYFKSANIADLLKLTPTEYMNNLLRNGAKEE